MFSLFQEQVPLCGRICCDSNGKLNAQSVVLEGSRETSAGKRIPLDLSDVTHYSLFPGQASFVIIRLLEQTHLSYVS